MIMVLSVDITILLLSGSSREKLSTFLGFFKPAPATSPTGEEGRIEVEKRERPEKKSKQTSGKELPLPRQLSWLKKNDENRTTK